MSVGLIQKEKQPSITTVKGKRIFNSGRNHLHCKTSLYSHTHTDTQTLKHIHERPRQCLSRTVLFSSKMIKENMKIRLRWQNVESWLILNSRIRVRLNPYYEFWSWTFSCWISRQISWIFQCPCESRMGVERGTQRALLYILHLIITWCETLG